MSLAGKKKWIALALLAVAGVAGYQVGWRWWGSRQYAAAQAALEQRDFLEASRRLQSCLELWPSDPALHLLAAQTARRAGNLDEAESLLARCEPNDAGRDAIDLEYRLQRVQRGHEEQGDLTETEDLLALADRSASASESSLILEAVIEGNVRALTSAFFHGLTAPGGAAAPYLTKMQNAVAMWLDRCRRPADQAQGLTWRGQLHRFAHEYDKAVADFTKALQIDPQHVEARMKLADLVVQRDPEAAAAHLQHLHGRFPNRDDVRLALAGIYRGLGRADEARLLLDAVLDANPQHVLALLQRGKLALDLQQPEQAERWLRDALDGARQRPDPNVEADINLALARCLQLLGRPDEARPFHDRFQQIEANRKRKHGPS